VGLTSTAFAYFLEAKPRGLALLPEEEDLLKDQFRKPRARVVLGERLASAGQRVTCMDNTDGVGQSLTELSELNDLAMVLRADELPIHPATAKVAEYLGRNAVDMALAAGADFQLVGTIEPARSEREAEEQIGHGLRIIGRTSPGAGLWLLDSKGSLCELKVPGWNYYATRDLPQ
jgi:thiamine-monophosphate kinase